MAGMLIKNGTIIDGTGAKARPGDVRVADGRIGELGQGLTARDGEEQFDAAGCHVTPGFIEAHTHNVVFDFDEVQQHDMEKVHDVTDGKGGITWRYTRKPAPIKLTLINGEATFRDNAYTGAKPGDFLEPTDRIAPVAIAAE